MYKVKYLPEHSTIDQDRGGRMVIIRLFTRSQHKLKLLDQRRARSQYSGNTARQVLYIFFRRLGKPQRLLRKIRLSHRSNVHGFLVNYIIFFRKFVNTKDLLKQATTGFYGAEYAD